MVSSRFATHMDELLLNSPINQSNDTSKAAECDGGGYIAPLSLLLLSYANCLAHHVYESHNKRSKADTAKGVRKSSPGRAPCGTTWHSTRFPSTEEPAAIDPRDDGVDCVLEPNKVEKSAAFLRKTNRLLKGVSEV